MSERNQGLKHDIVDHGSQRTGVEFFRKALSRLTRRKSAVELAQDVAEKLEKEMRQAVLNEMDKHN